MFELTTTSDVTKVPDLAAMAERTRAAEQLLRRHGDWSDRAVAERCGLDHKTVGRLRAAAVCDAAPGSPDGSTSGGPAVDGTAPSPRPAARLGRDGRLRPVDPVALRLRIAEVLAQEPTASLRWIAGHVGASPETVRDVRERLRRGDDPVPAGLRERRGAVAGAALPVGGTLADPGQDADDGAEAQRRSRMPDFAAWFAARAVDAEWRAHAGAVPLSRVYEVADQARARARAWQAFAQTLERRAMREVPAR
ncbi:MAG: hypothetical protein AB7H43_11170 [Acidimicrobiia bacterium]